FGDTGYAFGEILVAALDQPVGEHEHDVAYVETRLALDVLRTAWAAWEAQGWPLGGRGDLHRPGLGPADQYRRVACGGVGDGGHVGLDDRSRHGGELPAGRPVGDTCQFFKDAGRLVAGDGQGTPGVAQLRHILGRGQAVSHDIADRQVGSLTRQRHRVVPVPTDLPGRSGRPVARPDLQ